MFCIFLFCFRNPNLNSHVSFTVEEVMRYLLEAEKEMCTEQPIDALLVGYV